MQPAAGIAADVHVKQGETSQDKTPLLGPALQTKPTKAAQERLKQKVSPVSREATESLHSLQLQQPCNVHDAAACICRIGKRLSQHTQCVHSLTKTLPTPKRKRRVYMRGGAAGVQQAVQLFESHLCLQIEVVGLSVPMKGQKLHSHCKRNIKRAFALR